MKPAPPGCEVLVFSRAPVPGEAKRRLIPAIGAERAARLQEKMTGLMVDRSIAANLGPVSLWCTPNADHPSFAALTESTGVALEVQRGVDLGARMHVALEAALDRSPGAILVGSDCPFLDADSLTEAARALSDGSDVVLGPAVDGGYVLIGVRGRLPDLFSQMPWGTASVLDRTRERLRTAGCRWRELAARPDIDRPEDLASLDGVMPY